jgi:hypothetical protein
MTRKPLFVLLLVLISFGAACAEKDTKPPRVVSTSPTNGSQGVDPSTKEISVTFDEEMIDGNWSWAYTEKTSQIGTEQGICYLDKFSKT